MDACLESGLPVRLALTAGEAHDNQLADKLLSRLKSGSMLLADRGYDADWIRALAARKGALANIPPRCNRSEPICFSPYLYRARLVERFFNKIKHCRRVATRYDRLAANYLAFVQLASIRLWLRVNDSRPESLSVRDTTPRAGGFQTQGGQAHATHRSVSAIISLTVTHRSRANGKCCRAVLVAYPIG